MSQLISHTKGKKLNIPHFPTAYQALIFRLWEMVSADKIAEVIQTSVENVNNAAEKLGLTKQQNTDMWMTRGYISIIKQVWNLLPHEQILKLLDWDEERLSYVLKEDDYLGEKLGEKCDCERVLYRELTCDEEIRTEKIKKTMESFVNPLSLAETSAPFDFFSDKYKPLFKGTDAGVRVDSSWGIKNCTDSTEVDGYIERFKCFAKKYGVIFSENAEKCIELYVCINSDDEEYHEIYVNKERIIIKAAREIGILRGICYLESLAEGAHSFSFDTKIYKRKTKIKTRFIYSFCGLYGDVLDKDISVSFPDELLLKYSRYGINGIWIQGVLYGLAPYPFDERLSVGWEKRLKNLKKLTEHTLKYGIKVYMYINEPRSLPLSFFEKNPHLKGSSLNPGVACLCSSHEAVHDYLREAITCVCKNVPLLGGFINITQTENRVLCYSNGRQTTPEAMCPVCGKKKASEVISNIVKTMAEAVANANPKIKFFYYAWSLANTIGAAEERETICNLPKNTIILQVSETGIPFNKGGFDDEVLDYSMSIVGPGKSAKELWKTAKEQGLETAAKIQINNSWECSTAPFIPIYDNVVKHIKNLLSEGIDHIMLSWTLGGYLSDNIKIAAGYFFEDEMQNDDVYDTVLKENYGDFSQTVKKAVSCFCKGFSEYPFNWKHIYFGPSNAGSANLLYPENTKMKATMTCYPYDDIETWRGVPAKFHVSEAEKLYSVEVLKEQYMRLYTEWEKGLKLIKDMPICEFKDMAEYSYTLFKASFNQISYYVERNGENDTQKLREIVKDEMNLALSAYKIMLRNSAVGYEAANHYYVTRGMLAEKIVECEYLLNEYYVSQRCF